jgi:PAS domain S-box-containing protein
MIGGLFPVTVFSGAEGVVSLLGAQSIAAVADEVVEASTLTAAHGDATLSLWLGVLLLGVIGLVSSDDSAEALSDLAAKIDRLKSGDYDVDFGDPDDDLGEIRDALNGLADELETQHSPADGVYTDTVLDALDDIFYVLDEDTHLLRWNDAFREVTGYTDDELDGMSTAELFRESSQEAVQEAARTVIETGSHWTEAELQTRDGETIPYEFQATTAQQPDGTTVVAGVGRDISERVKRERELAERERELSTLMDNIPGMVYRARNEPDWPMEFVSDGCQAVTGYDAETLESEAVSWGADVVVDDNDELWEDVQQAVDDREPYQVTYQIETADGDIRWVWERGRGVFDAEGRLEQLEGVILDITDRKRTEQELEQTRQLLDQAQRLAGVGGWELDLTTDPPYEVDWTAEVADLLGLPPDTSLDTEDSFELYHPEDRPQVRAAVEGAIETEGSFDIEARLAPVNGTQLWVHLTGEYVEVDGQPRLRGALQDITEQKQRETALERTTDLLEETQRIANVGGWELDLSGETDEGTFTEQLYRIHDLPPDENVDFEDGLEYYHPADRPRVRAAVDRATEHGVPYEIEARFVPQDGAEMWVRTTGVPVYDDGEIVKLRGALQDITQQKERELALESLQEASRGLLSDETEQAVAQRVTDSADDVLDTAESAVYLLDDETNQLEPVATTAGFGGLREEVVVTDTELWDSFVTGDVRELDSESAAFDAEIRRGAVIPLREHGVFVLVTTEPALNEEQRWLTETFAATAEAALDRITSEATLRAHEDELETQNQRLKRQVQINTIIRSVHQSLIGTDTVSDIQRAVCERLVESDPISFAWIGGFNGPDADIEPRTWAGDGEEYLDEIPRRRAETSEPAVVTANSGEITVVENVIQSLGDADWRRSALVRDFHSVVSVPLSFDGRRIGVLTAYADTPETFTELEGAVFAELGDGIANSIITTTAQQALHEDTQIELSVRLACDSFLTRLAADAGCEVSYQGLTGHDTDETRMFLTTTGADEKTVLTALADQVAVTDARLVADRDDDSLFEVELRGDSVPVRLIRHGGTPQSIRATARELDIVVDVPTTTDVRQFLEMLETEYVAAELRSRQTVERTAQTRQEYKTALLENLTDRQLEVLRTAYYGGFFEWPRESTGEDIAEMLDVTQPTVNRHLRLAQQRLLKRVFDETVQTVDSSD